MAGFQLCEHLDLVFGGLTLHNLFLGYRRLDEHIAFFKGFVVAHVNFQKRMWF